MMQGVYGDQWQGALEVNCDSVDEAAAARPPRRAVSAKIASMRRPQIWQRRDVDA